MKHELIWINQQAIIEISLLMFYKKNKLLVAKVYEC